VFPISIAEVSQQGHRVTRGRRRHISQRQLAYTTQQLTDLLHGGLPLMNALTLLARQTEHPTLQHIIESLARGVREGQSLSEALTHHPRAFSALYINMVRAGELGGHLEEALAELGQLGEHEAELRAQVRSAMAYPMLILLIACGMTVFLITYVIPRLSLVLIETGQALPLPTRIVMSISSVVTTWWWALGIGSVVLGWAAWLWAKSPSGRATLDRLVLALPLFGSLRRKRQTAQFSRMLGVMIRQGVPILQALEVSATNLTSVVFSQSVRKIQVMVREGTSLAEALTASGQFPAFVSNMVAVGEEAGTVDTALINVAASYEREANRSLKTLMTFLEPLLLMGVGGVVVLIVLAMLLPIFEIGLGVQ